MNRTISIDLDVTALTALSANWTLRDIHIGGQAVLHASSQPSWTARCRKVKAPGWYSDEMEVSE
jgi:hypothetical protein